MTTSHRRTSSPGDVVRSVDFAAASLTGRGDVLQDRLMTTYEAWLSGRGFSHDTIRARTRLYRSRLREWGTLDVPPDVIADFLRRHTGWTRRTYHNHLSSMYEWMVDQGALEVSPMVGIKRAPTPRPKPKPLPLAARAAVLAHANPRTLTFLQLGSLAGLRAFEIAKFHGRDITEEHVRVIGKGGVDELLPTHPELWATAQRYPRDGYWFPPAHGQTPHIRAAMVTASVGRLFRRLGIEGAIHRARHTFATDLKNAGADMKVIQELMRHQSLATTALYLGVDEDERVSAIRSLAA